VAVDRVSLLGFLDHIDDAPPELAQLANIGYLLIGVGAFLTLMGFLGCCGAMKESKCMLLSVSVRMCSATADLGCISRFPYTITAMLALKY